MYTSEKASTPAEIDLILTIRLAKKSDPWTQDPILTLPPHKLSIVVVCGLEIGNFSLYNTWSSISILIDNYSSLASWCYCFTDLVSQVTYFKFSNLYLVRVVSFLLCHSSIHKLKLNFENFPFTWFLASLKSSIFKGRIVITLSSVTSPAGGATPALLASSALRFFSCRSWSSLIGEIRTVNAGKS